MFLSIEKEEQQYWTEWKFHSHRWEEWQIGKFQCTWCNSIYIQESDDKEKIDICRLNPVAFPKSKVDTTFY